jgi:hypothetical protein
MFGPDIGKRGVGGFGAFDQTSAKGGSEGSVFLRAD